MRSVLFAAGLALAAPQGRWADDPDPGGPSLVWLGTDQGMRLGAENIIFLHGAGARIEDRLIPVRLFAEERGLGRAANASWRSLRVYFLELPASAWLSTLQHEMYGHGYRAREAGYRDIEFGVHPPPPYGEGGGYTSWDFSSAPPAVGDANIAMAMAGIEGSDILAQAVRRRSLQAGALGAHAGTLYLLSALDLVWYAKDTPDTLTHQGNDVVAWLARVNRKAGRPSGDPFVDLLELQADSRWALADPYLYLSFWAVLRHLWYGESQWRYPMIPILGTRWLPVLGWRFSPWGGQMTVEALGLAGRRAFVGRAAFGDGPLGASRSVELEGGNLAEWKGVRLDAGFRLWSQPRLRTQASDPVPGAVARPGAGFEVSGFSPPLSGAWPLRLAAGAAWKSAGYVAGEPLGEGLTFRAGVGWGG